MSPVAKFGHIHGDHQGSEPQGFYPLDQLFVELPIWLHVELEPPEASGGRGNDVFQGTAGVCAGDVADAGCLGSSGCAGLSIGPGQAVETGGCYANGGTDLLPLDCGPGVHLRHIFQVPGPEADSVLDNKEVSCWWDYLQHQGAACC